jgi:hypothetical protein
MRTGHWFALKHWNSQGNLQSDSGLDLIIQLNQHFIWIWIVMCKLIRKKIFIDHSSCIGLSFVKVLILKSKRNNCFPRCDWKKRFDIFPYRVLDLRK